MQPLCPPSPSPRSLLVPVAVLGMGIMLSWLRVGLIVLGVWLVLLVIALVFAKRLRQPIVRIIVRGHPGLGQQIDVQGWWPDPDLPDVKAFLGSLELPIGSEIWARKQGDEVEVQSNLHDGAALEAMIRRFLAKSHAAN